MVTMASITEVKLVSDLDGGPADETIGLALDGAAYELDVSSADAQKLRDALAPYIAAARRVSSGPARVAPSSRSTSGSASNREYNAKVRATLKEHGFTVPERGRISNDLLAKFYEIEAAGFPSPTKVETKEAPALSGDGLDEFKAETTEEAPTEEGQPEKPKRSRSRAKPKETAADEQKSNVVDFRPAEESAS